MRYYIRIGMFFLKPLWALNQDSSPHKALADIEVKTKIKEDSD